MLEPESRSGQMYSVSRCRCAAGVSVLLSLLKVCCLLSGHGKRSE